MDENTVKSNQDDLFADEVSDSIPSSLKTVTPLSKYLALTLFIILPFLGGYIGYVYAPEKVVEVERVIEIEKSPDSDLLENINTTAEDVSSETTTYSDNEVGVTFSYPAKWGEITVNDEVSELKTVDGSYVQFDCSSEYNNEPCNFRTYLLKDIYQAGIFMAAETLGHRENPVGRGAFWGDVAGTIDSDYQTECKNFDDCQLVTNENGLVFAHYMADPPPREMGYMPERYYIYNANSPYYGLVLSPDRLSFNQDEADEISKIFRETIIESFNFTNE